MSSTSAYVIVILVLAFNSAPTSAVGASDADAAEAIPPPQPPARDLTVVQRIRADPALREVVNSPASFISICDSVLKLSPAIENTYLMYAI